MGEEVKLSKIQMTALEAVVSYANKLQEKLDEALKDQQTIIEELRIELGAEVGSRFEISPELQAKGVIKVYAPGELSNG